MKRRIVWSIILVPFIVIGLVFTIGCEEPEPTPKMTAPEVCQYVNQALRNEYISYSPTTRYEVRYTALSAVYQLEGRWLVNVKVVSEQQKLRDGQWVGTSAGGIVTQQYYFSETTGALTKR